MNVKNYIKNYKNRKITSIITDVLLLALIVVMLVPQWRREVGSVLVSVIMTAPDMDETAFVQLGEDDLSLAFSDKQGNVYRLENVLDQPVFITYWATWCHHCVAELSELDKLNRLVGNHIKIVVLVNEDLEKAEAYIRSKGYYLPLYVQRSRGGELLQTEKIPASFLINTNQQLVLKENGATKWGSDKFIEFIKNL